MSFGPFYVLNNQLHYLPSLTLFYPCESAQVESNDKNYLDKKCLNDKGSNLSLSVHNSGMYRTQNTEQTLLILTHSQYNIGIRDGRATQPYSSHCCIASSNHRKVSSSHSCRYTPPPSLSQITLAQNTEIFLRTLI